MKVFNKIFFGIRQGDSLLFISPNLNQFYKVSVVLCVILDTVINVFRNLRLVLPVRTENASVFGNLKVTPLDLFQK